MTLSLYSLSIIGVHIPIVGSPRAGRVGFPNHKVERTVTVYPLQADARFHSVNHIIERIERESHSSQGDSEP